jgi:xanthine dehydrogenase accessory factor
MVAIVGVLAILRGKAAPAAVAASEPTHALPDSAPRPASSAVGKFVNPVCGIEIDTAAPRHVERYEGTEYYFCCDGCWVTFRENPAKYAAIHHAAKARITV